MKRLKFLRDAALLIVAPDILKQEKGLDITIDVADPDGQNLSGIVPITVTAHPTGNLRNVQTLIDGVVVSDDPVSPYVYNWDTTKFPDGTHVIKAIAFYKTRQSTAQIAVTVNNSVVSTKPSIPTGLNASVNGNDVTLTWNPNPASENVDAYQVYENDQDLNLNVQGTTYLVAGLVEGTYTFRVSAHNSTGYGDWTESVTVTISGGVVALGRGIAYLRWGDGLLKSNPDKYDELYLTQNVLPLSNPPGPPIYMYVSGTNCNSYGEQNVPLSEARSNGWILKDAFGQEIYNTGYAGNYCADVGDPNFRARFCQHIEERLINYKAQGFFNDDVINYGAMWWNNPPAKYNATAWDDAIVGFCQVIYDYFHSRGYYVSHNCHAWISGDFESNNGMRKARFWARVGPYADALCAEYWLDMQPWGYDVRRVGPEWYNNWDAYRGLHKLCNGEPFPVTGGFVQLARPINFVGLGYNGTRGYQQYNLNSFLLDYASKGSAAIWHIDSSTDEWYPEYDKLPLGNPVGAAVKSGNVWTREFELGYVSVDPVAGTAPPITLK